MTIKLNIPKSWDELTPAQLKKISWHFYKDKKKRLDYLIFITLLNIRWWQIWKRYKAKKTIQNIPLSELKNHYNWLYDKFDLTKFIPKIKTQSRKTLLAPDHRISNLTADEFSHCEDLFFGWSRTKDFEYLQYLCAVLYREIGKNKKRKPFDKTELDNRAKKLSKTNKKTLLAIALSYQGSRNYLINQFPLVFPKTRSEKSIMKNEKTKNSGFGKLILNMSGEKFGTYNETKDTNIYTFLSEFQEKIKNS